MRRYRAAHSKYRRPFWLPASNYYILAAATAIGVFFLVWGILHDELDDAPYIPAGLSASVVLGGAVVLREIILRTARDRFLASQRLLDQSLRHAPVRGAVQDPNKLTLERNAAILHEITRKSEAAKVLGRLAESHREVFVLCEEYMAAAARELPTVGVGSPRIAALRRGSDIAAEYHHYHMLQWAEIQARSLTQDVQKHVKLVDKLGAANEALSVVDIALRYYPDEVRLRDSEELLRRLISSIQARSFVEKAERAKFKGNNKRAISLYEDALFHLARGGGDEIDTEAQHLREEIERLSGTFGG